MHPDWNDDDRAGSPADGDRDGPPVDRFEIVHAEVVEHAGRADECTLYPATVADDVERMSAWITARGTAFVDRDEMR